VRFAVAVRAVARKVELIVLPGIVALGDMAPGEERAFTVDVVNAGEIAAEIREAHVSGDLEVWTQPATVQPGERVTLAGRARVNTKQPRQQVGALVSLADEAAVRCVAQVVAPKLPTVLAMTAIIGGVLAGSALAIAVGLASGLAVAFVGFAVGVWIFWREAP
jgi:hypothetical protein